MPDQPLPSRSPREGDPVDERLPALASAPGSTDVATSAPVVTGATDDAPSGNGSADDDDIPPPPEVEKPQNRWRTAVEWLLVIGGALLVALLVRTFFIQAFWIPSDSMEPTLHKGDRVLVNKLSYKLHDVHRGDVIVFKRPEAAKSSNPDDDIEDLIKRVIGLPGDTIETVEGVIYINDEPLPEPYLPEGTRSDAPPVRRQTVPDGHVFVMGDNRGNSQDSRFFGPIDEDLIVGRAFVRIYPLGDFGGL